LQKRIVYQTTWRLKMKNYLNYPRFTGSRTLAGLLAVALLALGSSTTLAQSTDNEELPVVRMETSKGVMELRLRPDVAPQTVQNFLDYVRQGFYDGTVFHRVIPGFMIQGGGFTQDLQRKQTGEPVINEASETLRNLRGTIAMARTPDPDSATSQFFINLSDNDFLNKGVRGPGYTVFGKVTQGLGVADAIAAVPTGRRGGMADVPMDTVLIDKITVVGEGSVD
jgi:peptidyl-prolyl cis-trans isomerase A (cyclophilin A)